MAVGVVLPEADMLIVGAASTGTANPTSLFDSHLPVGRSIVRTLLCDHAAITVPSRTLEDITTQRNSEREEAASAL